MESFVPRYFPEVLEIHRDLTKLKEKIDYTRGIIQMYVHPFFGEDDSGVVLSQEAQAIYSRKRELSFNPRYLQGLPTIILMGVNEINSHPDAYHLLLNHADIVIPTPPGDPTPDPNGEIRQILECILSLMDPDGITEETKAVIAGIAQIETIKTNTDLFIEEAFSKLHQRELALRNSCWDQFLKLLINQLSVTKAIVRGKAYYQFPNGSLEGCVPEVLRKFQEANISVVASKVRYLEPYRL